MPGTLEGLKWAVPSPLPSLPLGPRPQARSPEAARAVTILRGRNQTGERKALGQNGISIPRFPAPVPLMPRPGAASSSQRWGWRAGQEGGGEDPGVSCPPPQTPTLSLSLLRLRAGSPGALVSEADRSTLSFLPAGGRGGAGRELTQMPRPLLLFPRSSRAWCPTKPGLSHQVPRIPEEGKALDCESRHLSPSSERPWTRLLL